MSVTVAITDMQTEGHIAAGGSALGSIIHADVRAREGIQ